MRVWRPAIKPKRQGEDVARQRPNATVFQDTSNLYSSNMKIIDYLDS